MLSRGHELCREAFVVRANARTHTHTESHTQSHTDIPSPNAFTYFDRETAAFWLPLFSLNENASPKWHSLSRRPPCGALSPFHPRLLTRGRVNSLENWTTVSPGCPRRTEQFVSAFLARNRISWPALLFETARREFQPSNFSSGSLRFESTEPHRHSVSRDVLVVIIRRTFVIDGAQHG